MTQMQKRPLSEDKLCFKQPGSQFFLVNRQELLYIEADREICHLNLANGERLPITSHLGFYKSALLEKHGFMEVSKSVLVNPAHLVRYKVRERLLQVSNGQEVVVAKSKKDAVNAFFQERYQQWEQATEQHQLCPALLVMNT